MTDNKSFGDRFSEHWLGGLIAAAVAAGAITVTVTNYLYIGPKNDRIEALKDENAKLRQDLHEAQAARPPAPTPAEPAARSNIALAETGVFEKASVTTSDGRCSIRIINVIGSQVTLRTTIDAGKPVEQRAEVGSRVTVDAGDIVYYI